MSGGQSGSAIVEEAICARTTVVSSQDSGGRVESSRECVVLRVRWCTSRSAGLYVVRDRYSSVVRRCVCLSVLLSLGWCWINRTAGYKATVYVNIGCS